MIATLAFTLFWAIPVLSCAHIWLNPIGRIPLPSWTGVVALYFAMAALLLALFGIFVTCSEAPRERPWGSRRRIALLLDLGVILPLAAAILAPSPLG